MHIFYFGLPLEVGGGNSEVLHTVLLWRKLGIDVTLVSLSKCTCGQKTAQPQGNRYCDILADKGCKFISAASRFLAESIPRDSIMVSMANTHLLHNWQELSDLGTKLIWSNCHTYSYHPENTAFRIKPPAVAHFQSEFQRSKLEGDFRSYGCQKFAVIPGAFDQSLYPFKPDRGDGFVVCRIARGSRTKWSPVLWPMLENARNAIPCDFGGIFLGWNSEVQASLGAPPPWAQCFAERAVTALDVLHQSHVMVAPNWTDIENWPRVGLEAMSAGTVIVADDAGGWKEQITHGHNGMLCSTPEKYTECLVYLANNPRERLRMAANARLTLAWMANEGEIGKKWLSLLGSL